MILPSLLVMVVLCSGTGVGASQQVSPDREAMQIRTTLPKKVYQGDQNLVRKGVPLEFLLWKHSEQRLIVKLHFRFVKAKDKNNIVLMNHERVTPAIVFQGGYLMLYLMLNFFHVFFPNLFHSVIS